MKTKKWMYGLVAGLLVLCGVLSNSRQCHAAEQKQITVNSFYEVNEAARIMQEADNNSTVVTELSAGDTIMVTGYDGGEWCEVSCDGKTGYIQIAGLTPIGDVDALNKEFENLGSDYENTFEEMLEIQKQKRNSRIWGGIIVALVVAIFAVGIVSAIKKNKEEEKK